MKKSFKYLLISGTVLVLFLCILWIIGIASFSGAFDKRVTREETEKNFADHETDIMYFSDLFLSTKPPQHEVSFSVSGRKGSLSIGMQGWSIDQRFPNHYFDFRVSGVNENTDFLRELGWDLRTFKDIVAAFRKTHCESAMTDQGMVDLGFKTGTWSSYSYHVRSAPMDDSTRKAYESAGIEVLNKRVTIGRATAL